MDADKIDLTDRGIYLNGALDEMLSALRKAGPVHRHPSVEPIPGRGPLSFWSVVRHAEVQQANRDWESFTARQGVFLYPDPLSHPVVTLIDPPEHTRLRMLINSGFTPKMVTQLEAQIEARVSQLLDVAGQKGQCDFVKEVAYQLPMHIIADIVGIPESDRPWVFSRSELMHRAVDPGFAISADEKQRAQTDLFDYVGRLTAAKRRNPTNDVWSLLAQAKQMSDDGSTSGLEVLELEMFFSVLTVAGSETTINALSKGLLAFLQNPDQTSILRASPGAVGRSAADEIIRWATPVLYFGRSVDLPRSRGQLSAFGPKAFLGS